MTCSRREDLAVSGPNMCSMSLDISGSTKTDGADHRHTLVMIGTSDGGKLLFSDSTTAIATGTTPLADKRARYAVR